MFLSIIILKVIKIYC